MAIPLKFILYLHMIYMAKIFFFMRAGFWILIYVEAMNGSIYWSGTTSAWRPAGNSYSFPKGWKFPGVWTLYIIPTCIGEKRREGVGWGLRRYYPSLLRNEPFIIGNEGLFLQLIGFGRNEWLDRKQLEAKLKGNWFSCIVSPSLVYTLQFSLRVIKETQINQVYFCK